MKEQAKKADEMISNLGGHLLISRFSDDDEEYRQVYRHYALPGGATVLVQEFPDEGVEIFTALESMKWEDVESDLKNYREASLRAKEKKGG